MQTQARWATVADAPFEILESKYDITIKKDGMTEVIFTVKIKILNEVGRSNFTPIPIYYVQDNSELEIITARITNGTEVYELDQEDIEDKPLASEIQAFDQTHQVLLAFPNVQVGSIIELKHVTRLMKPELPGYYEGYFEFVMQYWQSSSINITSELPLYINYNDPDMYLKITQGKHNTLHVLNIDLKKPIYISIEDESQNNINPAKYPWIFIATNNNTQQISQQIADPFLNVMQQQLPAMYESIVDQAKQHADPIMQINTVSSLLNENIQYMGDWKSANGRRIPQDFARVAQRRLGDCKDFATGTAAILRQLGMDARVALVQRYSGIYYRRDITLPIIALYNHAIVKVQVGKQIYWVDPTNSFSIADVILSDIADRPALVLSKDSKIEHIPQSKPGENSTNSVKIISIRDPSLATFSGTISVHGLAAIYYTGAELYISKHSIMNDILSEIGNFEYMIDQNVNIPPLTSRIVRDLAFDFKFKEKDYVSKSNAGFVLRIYDGIDVAQYYIRSPEQVSDLYIDAPYSQKMIYNYTNITPVDNLSLDNQLRSPWLDLTRTVRYSKDSVQVEYECQVKQSWIPYETMRSPEYLRMMEQLSKEFSNGVSIIFNIS